MANKLPPPPTKAEPGSFALQSWYQSLYNFLTTTGSVSWVNVDKTGSNLTDLAIRNHTGLQSVQGTGQYHLSATEQARVSGVISKAGDPTTSDITAGTWALYKNTSTGTIRLWTNDAGAMKGVTLT